LSVQFNSSNVDSDGTPITGWNWSFGDGTTGAAQNPSHVYPMTGTFSPSLIVTNSLGLVLAATGPAITVISELVTNTADSGPGTLRSAIANAANGAVIAFDPSLSGVTLTLNNTLTINTSLTIDASALPGGLHINGNHAVAVFNVTSNLTVFLKSLTITNGSGVYGGGIQNTGILTLTNCTLSGNSGDVGGGIYNGGTLTLNECTLSGNSAQFGGGIDNYEGTAMLNQCTLSGNSALQGGGGGGICSFGTLTLSQCTLSGNVAEYGGGIYNADILTMTNTIVGQNSAAIAFDIYNNEGTLTYGGSNLVLSLINYDGFIIGPNPLTNPPDLAPLGNYGGPTQTMPPLPGSPAIGAGSLAVNTFTNDQRGYPRTQNGLIDLGAVELPAVPSFTVSSYNGMSPLNVQFNSTDVDSDGSAITGWNWSFGDGTTGAGQNPSHVYSTVGIFSPSLIVTNSQGLTLLVSGPAINVSLTLLVTSTADSGPGTLRSVLTNAANGAIITFAPNLSGATITLASTLAINTNLTIDASTLPDGVRINGNGAVTVFNVNSNITVFLNSLTITGGHTASYVGGAGIINYGTMTLNNCTLSGNYADWYGGGIYSSGTLTLNQCTLSGNSAYDGGGIYSSGTLKLNQCTLSGNTGEYSGGIDNLNNLALNQCTLSGNSAEYYGGGIYNDYHGALTITNTIVAGNSPGADIYNYYATLTYGGSNLVQSVNFSLSITGPDPLTSAPDLAPLGNYGGRTQTMPPLPGSPAIGAGSVTANTFSTDQRGYPRTQNGLLDLGAVELPTVQPFTATPTSGTGPLNVQFNSTHVDSDGGAITGWNWNFGDNQTGAAQNPSHVYSNSGKFSPSLIVTNSLGLALAVSGPSITVLPFTIAPTSFGITGSGTSAFMQFSFTNASGLSFSVLATNNITAPVSTWPVIGAATENPPGSGHYQFTDSNPATNAGEYYILRQP
jgi:PKD repeat protein